MIRSTARRRKKKKQERLNLLLILFFAAVALFSAVQLGRYIVQSIQTRQETRQLQEMYRKGSIAGGVIPAEAAEEAAEAVEAAAEIPQEETEVLAEATLSPGQMAASLVGEPIQEKFRTLYHENSDTVGWVTINGVLDLPVVQRDNSYYLTHDFNGRRSNEGTVFLEDTASIRPKSNMLCLYGHNMKDGSMFAGLTNYSTVTYYKNHPVIHFDTLYETGYYIIFAAFTFSTHPEDSDYFPLRHADSLGDSEVLAQYAMSLKSASNYWVPIDLSGEDEYLSLITCTYTHDNARFAVFARRIRDGESVSTLRQAAKEAY